MPKAKLPPPLFIVLLFARRHHVQQRGRPADEQRARLAKVRAVAVVDVAVPRARSQVPRTLLCARYPLRLELGVQDVLGWAAEETRRVILRLVVAP